MIGRKPSLGKKQFDVWMDFDWLSIHCRFSFHDKNDMSHRGWSRRREHLVTLSDRAVVEAEEADELIQELADAGSGNLR